MLQSVLRNTFLFHIPKQCPVTVRHFYRASHQSQPSDSSRTFFFGSVYVEHIVKTSGPSCYRKRNTEIFIQLYLNYTVNDRKLKSAEKLSHCCGLLKVVPRMCVTSTSCHVNFILLLSFLIFTVLMLLNYRAICKRTSQKYSMVVSPKPLQALLILSNCQYHIHKDGLFCLQAPCICLPEAR